MKRFEINEPLRYARHASPFGPCWIALRGVVLSGLSFGAGGGSGAGLPEPPAEFRAGCRDAFVYDPGGVAEFGKRLFALPEAGLRELQLWTNGTEFQQKVWQALRRVPQGHTLSYGELARRIGAPGAARAVGAAVGANRIAYVVPCHRVLRTDGGIGGFRWGIDVKRTLLEAEGVRVA